VLFFTAASAVAGTASYTIVTDPPIPSCELSRNGRKAVSNTDCPDLLSRDPHRPGPLDAMLHSCFPAGGVKSCDSPQKIMSGAAALAVNVPIVPRRPTARSNPTSNTVEPSPPWPARRAFLTEPHSAGWLSITALDWPPWPGRGGPIADPDAPS